MNNNHVFPLVSVTVTHTCEHLVAVEFGAVRSVKYVIICAERKLYLYRSPLDPRVISYTSKLGRIRDTLKSICMYNALLKAFSLSANVVICNTQGPALDVTLSFVNPMTKCWKHKRAGKQLKIRESVCSTYFWKVCTSNTCIKKSTRCCTGHFRDHLHRKAHPL